MIEVRIHGRGGQGAVVASLVIAHAAHHNLFHVQVFPEFGVERRGVPVTAFARLDHHPIRLRAKVTEPHHILILDPTLARTMPVTAGLREGGWIIANAAGPELLAGFRDGWRLAWVDGTSIAARHGVGTATAPIVNTTMVGAFAAVTGLFGVEHLERAMQDIYGGGADRNAKAAGEAYHAVQVLAPHALATPQQA